MSNTISCPCGSGQSLALCCDRYIQRQLLPATAVALMRSRYTAYVCGASAYLLETWHASTRPDNVNLDEPNKWLGLEVLRCESGGPEDEKGTVEFRASYAAGRGVEQLHEVSVFTRENGKWYYLEGAVDKSERKIGRNQLCPCGSGKKYKRCCGS